MQKKKARILRMQMRAFSALKRVSGGVPRVQRAPNGVRERREGLEPGEVRELPRGEPVQDELPEPDEPREQRVQRARGELPGPHVVVRLHAAVAGEQHAAAQQGAVCCCGARALGFHGTLLLLWGCALRLHGALLLLRSDGAVGVRHHVAAAESPRGWVSAPRCCWGSAPRCGSAARLGSTLRCWGVTPGRFSGAAVRCC